MKILKLSLEIMNQLEKSLIWQKISQKRQEFILVNSNSATNKFPKHILSRKEINEIKLLRENKELNQYELAEKFGVTRTIIRKVLKGAIKNGL